MTARVRCGLCGHQPPCGNASVTLGNQVVLLCHASPGAPCSTPNGRSCYVRWTVYGERPAQDPIGAIVDALRLAAKGRCDYAQSAPADSKEWLRGEALAYSQAARLLETRDVYGFIADVVPSWMWPKAVDQWVMRNGTPSMGAPPSSPDVSRDADASPNPTVGPESAP